MKKSRRNFIFRLVQLSILGLAARIITACGGGGAVTSGGTVAGGNCSANGTIVMVSTNGHTHPAPTISAGDVTTGTDQTYTLADGGSGHTHTVLVTAASFTTLQANNGVALTSSNSGHTHTVSINCA
jgi:hypothetical protein